MVRVIEKAATKQTTCYNCKAKLEYEFADVFQDVVKDYGGGVDTYHRITCPCCHLKNNVSRW